jgi:tetratricopeptide (TPR) repeat protein
MSALSPRLWPLLLLVGLSLATLRAHADDGLKDDPRARQFFEVGAQAYNKGQYLLAIDAFEEAYAITQRPGLLFSLAQAHQRQFRASGDEQHLAQAIEHYRRYLARVGSGGRHAEASALLNSLLVVAERLHPPNQASPGRSQVFGRLLLSSSTPEAKLTVNGETVESVPTALELPADKYRVIAAAPGFETSTQEVSIVAGSTVPLNLELRPLPAKLQISGPAGAEVFVDGRSVGWLPMAVLALPAGEHWISLRRSGKKTRSALVRIQRGQTAQLELTLESTSQRDAAWVVGTAAVIGVGVTGTFAILAQLRDREATSLDRDRREQGITPAQGLRLNAALDARDELRAAATVAGVTTAVMIGSTLLLYFADTPAPPWGGASHAQLRRPRPGIGWQPLLGSVWGLSAGSAF